MVVPDCADLGAWITATAHTLRAAMQRQLRRHGKELTAHARLLRDPRQVLTTLRLRTDELGERLLRATTARLRLARGQLQSGADHLQALSPLAVLERGYSIARRADTGVVVRDARALAAGDELDLAFARGSARVRVAGQRGD